MEQFVKFNIVFIGKPGQPVREGCLRADWIISFTKVDPEYAKIGAATVIEMRDSAVYVQENLDEVKEAVESALKQNV